MRGLRNCIAAAAIASAPLACWDASTPISILELGDPCLSKNTDCLDGNMLKVCRDRVWTAIDCVAECDAQNQVATECGEYRGNDDCRCAPKSGNCLPGQRECLDQNSVRHCEGDGSWTTVSCTDACDAIGLISIGCVDLCLGPMTNPSRCTDLTDSQSWDCLCSNDGLECEEEGQANCTAPSLMTRCEEGTWSLIDCRNECDDEDGICDPYSNDGPACIC